jgi:hypothetical protein
MLHVLVLCLQLHASEVCADNDTVERYCWPKAVHGCREIYVCAT